jgi:hypothetical protein
MILIQSVASVGPFAMFIACAGIASLLIARDEARFAEQQTGPRR